jgi:NTE family protein
MATFSSVHDTSDHLALVMGGGGARSAYQVGVLRSIARRHPQLSTPILTGVSAGAINTAYLASDKGEFAAKIERMRDHWLQLTTDRVFRSDPASLMRIASRWGLRLVSGGKRITPQPRGMVDTTPLREFLQETLACQDGALVGIAENLRRRALHAVAVTTTDYATGRSITHVQSNGAPMWLRPHRVSIEAPLTIDHVMASAALPLFFPAVKVGESWHGDGGVGLTAPLSPALHLGAERILAISTRYERTTIDANQPATQGYPPPAQVVGLMFNAVFLDLLDQDAMNLDRINRLIEAVPIEQRLGLRPVRLLLLRPSRNLSTLAGQFEPRLPQPFKFLMRGTGTKETKSPESLSMVMFEPHYIRSVIELGEEDGDRRADEIDAFLVGEHRPGLMVTGFWRV